MEREPGRGLECSFLGGIDCEEHQVECRWAAYAGLWLMPRVAQCGLPLPTTPNLTNEKIAIPYPTKTDIHL